jgi:hypothetical protein
MWKTMYVLYSHKRGVCGNQGGSWVYREEDGVYWKEGGALRNECKTTRNGHGTTKRSIGAPVRDLI